MEENETNIIIAERERCILVLERLERLLLEYGLEADARIVRFSIKRLG